jgi:hypothetical protein
MAKQLLVSSERSSVSFGLSSGVVSSEWIVVDNRSAKIHTKNAVYQWVKKQSMPSLVDQI